MAEGISSLAGCLRHDILDFPSYVFCLIWLYEARTLWRAKLGSLDSAPSRRCPGTCPCVPLTLPPAPGACFPILQATPI